MIGRDVVDHRNRERKLRKHLYSVNSVSSKKVVAVVRSNVKRVALSRNRNDHSRSNDHADHSESSSHVASVSRRQPALNRRRSNQNTSVHRRRRNSNSLSRSAVIPVRAKARNHKP